MQQSPEFGGFLILVGTILVPGVIVLMFYAIKRSRFINIHRARSHRHSAARRR